MMLPLRRMFMLFALISLGISCANSTKVIDLNENNWHRMLEGEWMVEFFAPWCPACKSIAPIWEEFAGAAEKYGVHVAVVDVTKSPSLSGRFFVTALPTIYHVNNGDFRQYRGTRNKESFLSYVKDKQWKEIEKLSAWKQPNSIHMSVLSYFFKLSHYLKDLNTHLHEDYGLPSWGSYALFAVGTIFLGALLGLVLVCIVDFICPPKKAHRQSFSETKEFVKKGGTVEDLPADELEDDEPEEPEEEDQEDSGSEAEKNSGSDTESDDENRNVEDDIKPKDEQQGNDNEKDVGSGDNIEEDNDKTSSQDIRKRKPRKAD